MPVYGKKFVLDWCMNEGLIAIRYECQKCGKQMNLTKQPKLNDGYEWKCRSRSKVNPHDCSRSVTKGSWFAGSHLTSTDDVAGSESPAPVPEVVPEPKDVPVSATPSDDMPPGPVPDASGKPKTDVPLRRTNRIRRPPERLDL
ncbi:hypothetical protein HNY73_007347 [Argiope bruennichi]|uniref:Uncharacterized protein n=1 Tax=Argiope bruennichi TaxID=94029 RepID=A0A8T0FGQ4_ARGBR|nr:hypothetical protein HNY73_007347 [Argiope bruennichi]